VAMAAVLLPYGAGLPVALLLSTLPAFLVVIQTSRRYHAWWNDTTLTRRRIFYYDALLTEPFAAAEIRMLDTGSYFQSRYQHLRQQFRSARLHLLKKQYWAKFGAELMAMLISGAAMLSMLYRAVMGAVTLGDLALFAQAFQRGQGLVRTLLSNVGQIYSNSLYLSNLFEFLGLKSEIIDAPHALPAPETLNHAISFRNVTFRYPGRQTNSLTNFTAFFPAGKIIALVGENGAGKTTLLKLLARFYDPQAGTVALDGVDIRHLTLSSLRSAITFMFQTPVYYQMTASENIALGLGSLEAADDRGTVHAAAASAGAHDLIAKLPNGYDTLLGRLFPGGSELSGGEWQRIALARAFIRGGHIVLLDEPTSSMDPWSEADWYRRLRTLAQGRTVIVATHRPTIAMRADLIFVMSNGQIVESGTHDELIALEGAYTESWRAQMAFSPRTGELQITAP
jgi:ATP-binding cassette, subfamily B, bacterial